MASAGRSGWPVTLFERRSPILGRVLGRLALLVLASIAVSVAGNVFELICSGIVGSSSEVSMGIGATVVSSAFGLLLELPLTTLTFTGILLTYAEQRGYKGPVNVQTLAGEL